MRKRVCAAIGYGVAWLRDSLKTLKFAVFFGFLRFGTRRCQQKLEYEHPFSLNICSCLERVKNSFRKPACPLGKLTPFDCHTERIAMTVRSVE
jgi:hypothetical protein